MIQTEYCQALSQTPEAEVLAGVKSLRVGPDPVLGGQ